MILDHLLLDGRIMLFRDDKQTPWARIKDGEISKNIPCNSTLFELWCRKLIYEEFDVNPSNQTLNVIIDLLKTMALFGSNDKKLYNRIAWQEDKLVYDLSNNSWDYIEIDEDGWRIIKNGEGPLVFKRFSHQKAQVTPEKSESSSVIDLLRYVNITNEDQKVLFVVWVVSCFIPDIPHPLAYFYGPQGSAKSTISRITQDIIDPTLLGISTFPKDPSNLIQQFEHNLLSFFDNVSYIDKNLSDLLCRAITGVGMAKRKLYTDDEDIIYNFKRSIGINGINLEGVQPDLLERSILFSLERVSDDSRVSEKALIDEFNNNKDKILGSIFTTLSKAITIKQRVDIDSTPRMADFTLWGCAIAEALGYSQTDFLEAYKRNIDGQTEEAINGSDIAVTVRDFMQDKNEWRGSPRELYRALSDSLFGLQESKHIDLPKNEVILGKKIRQLEIPLEKIGIEITYERGEKRIIRLVNKRFIADTNVSNDSKIDDSAQNKIPF